MNRTTGLAAAAALATLAGIGPTAQAGQDTGSLYFAPLATGNWLDDRRRADDDVGFAFAVGKAVSEKWNIEFGAGTSSHDIGNAQKLRFKNYELAAQRVFYRESRVMPFLSLGFGRLDDRRPSVSSDGGFYLRYGAGILADLRRNAEAGTNLQLRAEIFGRRAEDDTPGAGSPVDYIATLGLQYNWGAPVAAVARDLPPPPAEEPPPPPPPPAPVDGDDDGDGVPNSKDKCPGTPPGAKVDENGCECGDIILRGVTFATGQAELTPQSLLILDSVAAGLAKRPGAKIEVRGHTDDVGSETSNLALSERRAEAVKAYFVSKGLEAANLTTIGLGEMQHIAPNDSEAGREQNRRTTIQILSVVCDERAPDELVLRGVNFATGSARITPTSQLVIDSAVRYLQARPAAQIEVRGHTDNVGADDPNQKLSQARAEAVREALIKGGVEGARLTALGLGEAEPIASNDTPDGRLQNRRVTLRIKP